MKRITIKVGSNVLTREDGSLNVTRMSAIVDQIASLRKMGIEVILVSSGAVASGRSELKRQVERQGLQMVSNEHEVDERQLYSAIGQAKLMNRYYELFRDHGIHVGQVLTTKENFIVDELYRNQMNCMTMMLRNDVLPIVNENDTVSITELMFTDNDELSGLITTMMEAEMLIILSNIDGVYTGCPNDENSRLLTLIHSDDDLNQYIQSSKSTLGRGGMQSKSSIAQQIAAQGTTVMIANGCRENVIIDLITNKDSVPHSEFCK